MKKDLTARQRQVLEYVKQHIAENRTVPTLTEIAGHFGFSCSTAAYHIEALQKKKHLDRSSNARSIKLKSMADPCGGRSCPSLVPVQNAADCEPVIKTVFVPEYARQSCPQEKIIAVRVDDDSMIGLGIFNGDIVLGVPVAYRKPQPGDLVIAVLDDGSFKVRSYYPATVRRFELAAIGTERTVKLYPVTGNNILAVVVSLTRGY